MKKGESEIAAKYRTPGASGSKRHNSWNLQGERMLQMIFRHLEHLEHPELVEVDVTNKQGGSRNRGSLPIVRDRDAVNPPTFVRIMCQETWGDHFAILFRPLKDYRNRATECDEGVGILLPATGCPLLEQHPQVTRRESTWMEATIHRQQL
jgi:hypothetical protein